MRMGFFPADIPGSPGVVTRAIRANPRRAMLDDIAHGVFPIVLVPDQRMEREDRENFIPRADIIGTAFAIGDGQLAVTAAHVVSEFEERIRPNRPDTQHLKLAFWRDQGPRPMYVGLEGGPGAILAGPEPSADVTQQQAYLAQVQEIHYLPLRGERRAPDEDLALLRLERPTRFVDIRPLKLAEEQAWIGDEIYVVGYPNGREMHSDLYQRMVITPSFSSGIVSAVLPVSWAAPVHRTLFQIDATTRQGHSGSPVVDRLTGQVVGVVSADPSFITYPVTVPAEYVGDLESNPGRLHEIEDELPVGRVPVRVEPQEASMGFARVIDVSIVRELVDSAPAHWPRLPEIGNSDVPQAEQETES